MLVTERPVSGACGGQGCLRPVLAELQRQGAGPSACDDGFRQRLLVLAQRLARVQTLGNEYARVGFSSHVEAALQARTAAV